MATRWRERETFEWKKERESEKWWLQFRRFLGSPPKSFELHSLHIILSSFHRHRVIHDHFNFPLWNFKFCIPLLVLKLFGKFMTWEVLGSDVQKVSTLKDERGVSESGAPKLQGCLVRANHYQCEIHSYLHRGKTSTVLSKISSNRNPVYTCSIY